MTHLIMCDIYSIITKDMGRCEAYTVVEGGPKQLAVLSRRTVKIAGWGCFTSTCPLPNNNKGE